MGLQVIKDGNGKDAGVFIPISDWDLLTQKHEDLKQLMSGELPPKRKLSEFAGTISHETAMAMLKYVEDGRNEWEERLKKQFE